MNTTQSETASRLQPESGRYGNQVSRPDDTSDSLSPQEKWNKRNPQAMWAHACLRSAINRGLIERGPCEVCGKEKTDGHHDDYDKPMAVRWLCRLHHRRVHAGNPKSEIE